MARNYSSTAVQTTITTVGGITAAATTFTVASATGFPTAPFTLVLDSGTANEELVLVTASSGTTMTTVTRGYDSTTAVAHSAGATVIHAHAAIDFRETLKEEIGWKADVKYATTGVLTGTPSATFATTNGGTFTNVTTTALDGTTTVAAGDRVLVKNQASAFQNGIFVVGATTSTWTRDTDANTIALLAGSAVNVMDGTTNGGTIWTTNLKVTGSTLNTTAINWYQVLDTSQYSATNPTALGTAAPGSALTPARSDHVHPTTGVALTSGGLGQFTAASTTSAQLSGLITDETGSGAAVFATSPTLVTPLLGTPTSGTLTNCTGYTVGNISGLGTGVATFLATPSSANFDAMVTDPTGSGLVVLATNPVITPAAPSGTTTGTVTTSATTAGYLGMPQILNPATPYTLTAADAGKHIYMTTTGRTITIPANTAVAFQIGTTFSVINATGVTTTIGITTDTLWLAGSGTTGNRTLAPFGMATAVKVTATGWVISGNGLT